MASSSRPRVVGDTPRHTLIIDWDGTAVPAMWPDRPTEFLPGFVEAMMRFNAAGYHLQIFSARLNPIDPWTKERRPDDVMAEEVAYIRRMLDSHGLHYIDIWLREGKPGGSVYIDDKAERYHGRPGSWRALTDKILLRLGSEEAVFPITNGEEPARV